MRTALKSNKTPSKPRAPKAPKVTKAELMERQQRAKEDLLAKVGAVLEFVDDVMATRDGETDIEWRWRSGALGDARLQIASLRRELDFVLNPTRKYSGPDIDDVVAEAFGAKPGEVPAWSRPGKFVLWVGTLPTLCTWGGFFTPEARVGAVDRYLPWIYRVQSEIVESGTIPADCTTVKDFFRDGLSSSVTTPGFKVRHLDDHEQKAIVATRTAAEDWLRAVLEAGPVNPVAMPPKAMEIQQRLF